MVRKITFVKHPPAEEGSQIRVFDLWEKIGKQMQEDQEDWKDILRAMRIKLWAPEDGYVNRKKNWVKPVYARFNDGPKEGDLIAIGDAPDGHFYEPCRESSYPPHKRRMKSPESAREGFRICRVTSVEKDGKWDVSKYYHYEDTGMRIPAPRPEPTLAQRMILWIRY